MRFILVSFGFLGWAFYEMSGGADFSAEEMRTARLEAAAIKEAEKQAAREANRAKAAAVVVAEAPKVVVDKEPAQSADVTRVSLNLTNVSSTAALTTTLQQQADVAVPQNVSVVTSSAETPAIIPSLIDPDDGITTSASAAVASLEQASGDIRTVSGNRVNVRGGPGTDFNVVGRLVRGDAIRVVQDDGNGWVRFEAVDSDTRGWMADFLLTGG